MILGFGPLYFIRLQAQETRVTEKDVLHIKMMMEKDGQQLVVDTVIENAGTFDVFTYLESKGIAPHPRRTMVLGGSRILDSLLTAVPGFPGDSSFGMHLPRCSGMPAAPFVFPPSPPFPEIPEMPAIPEEVWQKISSFETDSFRFSDTTIILDPDDVINLNWLQQNAEANVVVHKRVRIIKLDEEEKKALKTGKNNLKAEQFSLYPNPGNGLFRLRFTLEKDGNTQIRVTALGGKEVYSEQLTDFSGTCEKEIDLSREPKGVYYLTVKQGKRSMTQKLVIE